MMRLATRAATSLMLGYCIALHYIWVVALLSGPDGGKATAASWLWEKFGDLLPLVLFVVATLALVTILWPARRLAAVVLLLPQQAVLTAAAVASTKAMIAGHYADGTVVTAAHLVIDQSPTLLAAVFHTFAILRSGWSLWPR